MLRTQTHDRSRRTVQALFRGLLALSLVLAFTATTADAARLKDMASVKGVRSNQIIGYGLVVGLRGTGDKAGARFTTQSLRSLLSKMGIALDPAAIRIANVAAVNADAACGDTLYIVCTESSSSSSLLLL